MTTPSSGLRAGQGPRRSDLARHARSPLERGDAGEGAQVHERVGREVEQDRLEALRSRPRAVHRQADHDVAGVSDRAVRQHPLDVVLAQRHEVAQGHREHREHAIDEPPVAAAAPAPPRRGAASSAKAATFGPTER